MTDSMFYISLYVLSVLIAVGLHKHDDDDDDDDGNVCTV